MNHCKDIMAWEAFPKYDVIWTDPPWEQKMVKYFETMMHKAGVPKPGNDIDAILSQLFKLAHPWKPMYVEYSVSSYHRVVNIAEQYGHDLKQAAQRRYANDLPFVVLAFNTTTPVAEHKNCDEVITNTLKSIAPYGRVFDPFAGIGVTAKAVKKAGWEYEGSEINPARFERLNQI